jgi:hypothetical protein
LINAEKREMMPGSTADRSFLTHVLHQDESSDLISTEYHSFLLPTISSYPANPAVWPYNWDRCDIFAEEDPRGVHDIVLQSTPELVSKKYSSLTPGQQHRIHALVQRFKDREGNVYAKWSLQHIGSLSARRASASHEEYVILKRSDRRWDLIPDVAERSYHRRHVRSRWDHAPERSTNHDSRPLNGTSRTQNSAGEHSPSKQQRNHREQLPVPQLSTLFSIRQQTEYHSSHKASTHSTRRNATEIPPTKDLLPFSPSSLRPPPIRAITSFPRNPKHVRWGPDQYHHYHEFPVPHRRRRPSSPPSSIIATAAFPRRPRSPNIPTTPDRHDIISISISISTHHAHTISPPSRLPPTTHHAFTSPSSTIPPAPPVSRSRPDDDGHLSRRSLRVATNIVVVVVNVVVIVIIVVVPSSSSPSS